MNKHSSDQDLEDLEALERAAWSSWLALAVLSSAGALIALAGVVVGWHEWGHGLTHLYGVCRRALPAVLPWFTLTSLISVLGFAATVGTGLGVVWDASRTGWLTGHLRSRARTPAGPLSEAAGALGLRGRVLEVEDAAPYAVTSGLWRPRIFVSSGLVSLLNQVELLAVLGHEAYHLRHHDPAKLLLGQAVRRALFFFPIIAHIFTRYRVTSELAADAYASATCGALPLASALLKVVDAGRSPEAFVAGSAGMSTLLNLRIDYLLGAVPPSLRHAPLWSRFLLTLGVVSVFLALLPPFTPPSFMDALAHAGLTCHL